MFGLLFIELIRKMMNSTLLMDQFIEGQWLEYMQTIDQIGSSRVAHTVVMMVIFVVGMIGNVVTCWVICSDRSMHTVTNYYLIDLAVSDIMILLSVLVEVIYNSSAETPMLRNDVDCRWVFFMVGALWNNGILIMTAVAVERYAAIVHPLMVQRGRVRRRVLTVVVGVWAVAVLETLPEVFTSRLVDTRREPVCLVTLSQYSRAVNAAAAVVTFLLPLGVMTYVHVVIAHTINARQNNREDKIFNSRDNRKKVNKLVIALTLSFLLCWLPFFSMRLIIASSDPRVLFALAPYWELWYEVMSASALFSSVLNPLLFSLMSTKFRIALKKQWHSTILRRNEGVERSVRTNVTFD